MNLLKVFFITPGTSEIAEMNFDLRNFGDSGKSYLPLRDKIEDIFLNIKFQLCVSIDFFELYGFDDKFWTSENKQKLRIFFRASEFDENIDIIKFLLVKKFCLDIYIEEPLALTKLNTLQGLSTASSSLRLIIVESSNFSSQKILIFDMLQIQLQSQVYFMYLPHSDGHQLWYKPEEVLSMLKRRNDECHRNHVELKVISVVNETSFEKSPFKKSFYLHPNLENYFKTYLDYQTEDSSEFSKIVRRSFLGLQVGIEKLYKLIVSLGFIFIWKIKHFFWFIEELFEHGIPKIVFWLNQFYWYLRPGVGRLHVTRVKLSWRLRSTLSAFKISMNRTRGGAYRVAIDTFWQLARPALKSIWKAYSVVRSLLSFTRNFLIQLFWLIFPRIKNISGLMIAWGTILYWKLKRFLDFNLNYVKSIFWKLRRSVDFFSENCIQLFWHGKPQFDRFLNLCEQAFWRMKSLTDKVILFLENIFWRLKWLIDKVILFLENIFWKMKSLTDKVILFLENMYWKAKTITHQLNHFLQKLYWKIVNSKVVYPFFKSYWFLKFQLQKRVFVLFKKKKSDL